MIDLEKMKTIIETEMKNIGITPVAVYVVYDAPHDVVVFMIMYNRYENGLYKCTDIIPHDLPEDQYAYFIAPYINEIKEHVGEW